MEVTKMFELMPFDRSDLDLFDRFFNTNEPAPNLMKLRVDLEDKGDHYELTADLPGFSKEDVEISIDDKIMTIHAEKSESKESREKNYICRERRSGSFSRSFDISGIDADAISGSFKDGVLTVLMPRKVDEKKNRRIAISDGSEKSESQEAGIEAEKQD